MQKVRVKPFDRSLFPAIYRCADDASVAAQSWYLVWVRVNLALLASGAVLGSVIMGNVDHKRVIQTITATLFFAAVGTTILLATRRWERVWYAGRAVAESAKSLTWKFICGADPFPKNITQKEAVHRFTTTLQELLEENKHLSSALIGPDATGEQVTSWMTGLRDSAVGVARDVYLSQRVNEQQAWYAKESFRNRKARNIWFCLLVAFQVAAGAAAVILAVEPNFPWRATAVFSTFASITLAWGQVKRFQELAQSYGLAAHELSLVAARGPDVGTREELARFVNDAETAISREHSMWVARRETK